MDTFTKQVDKSAYALGRYAKEDRFASYAHQLKEIAKLKPENMLEIGVGDKLVGEYVKANSGIAYTSADIADDVGAMSSHRSSCRLRMRRSIWCAFEVMEHSLLKDLKLPCPRLHASRSAMY